MLSEIEKFILGGNVAHDILEFKREDFTWELVVASNAIDNEKKSFLFKEVEIEYEERAIGEDEIFEYPLPMIGFECWSVGNEKWRFVLNAGDVEWAFSSKWPIRT